MADKFNPQIQSRPKQYVALQSVDLPKHPRWHKGQMVRLTESEALPLVEARILTPLNTAIVKGLYPTEKESVVERLKDAVIGEDEPEILQEKTTEAETENPQPEGGKSFFGNRLRDAVQSKKSLSAEKLAAIQSGGKK